MSHHLCLLFFLAVSWMNLPLHASIQTIFGSEKESPPLLHALLHTPAVLRLSDVNEGGIASYYHSDPLFKSYDHAMALYILLRRYGASDEECLAAFLSRIIQPVFCHSRDILFLDDHDDISAPPCPFGDSFAMEWAVHYGYLKKQQLDTLIIDHGLSLEELFPLKSSFKMVHSQSPDVSLISLEATLHTAYLHNLISAEECEQVIQQLRFYKDEWIFTDIAAARRVGYLSLQLTRYLWTSEVNVIANFWGEQAVARARQLKLVSPEEIHFGSDSTILSRLEGSRDRAILRMLERVKNPFLWCYRIAPTDRGYHLYSSFRGLAPKVWLYGRSQYLTDCDKDYRTEFLSVREWVGSGVHFALYTTSN